MSKTYTLSATITCKRGSVRSATLANYTTNYTSNTIIGSTGASYQYACILAFDSTTMAHLRGLAATAITSSSLVVKASTAASGNFHPYYGAKKDSGTASAEISASNNVAVSKSATSITLNVKSLGFPDSNAFCIGSQTNTSGETYATMRGITATLTVVTTETDYTLSYNANGGSGAPSSQSATGVGSAKFTISSTSPTRSGYVFKGWATSSTATSASYQPGGTITISTNTTLYAVWHKTFKLIYNANGGSGAPSSQSGTGYSSYTFTISSTVPTRSNYTFLGWGGTSTNTYPSTVAGKTLSVSDAEKTIYAVWRENSVLTYNANGGSGEPSSTRHGNLIKGSNTLQTSSPSAYNCARFTLANGTTYLVANHKYIIYVNFNNTIERNAIGCWIGGGSIALGSMQSITSSGSHTYKFEFTATSAMAAATQVLYIYSSTTGGTQGSTPISGTCTVNWIDIYDIPSITISSTVPTKSDSEFLGWADSSTAVSAAYESGDTIRINANKTIYAVWVSLGCPIHYYNGSTIKDCELYYYNGTTLKTCELYYFNGTTLIKCSS